MNFSYITDEYKNEHSKSDNQGLEYITKYNSITEENNNPKGIDAIEGFSNLFNNDIINEKNKNEINELLKLQKEYQKKLYNYTKSYDLLFSNVNQYFELRKSPLLNKNIRLSDGKIGYVTKEGVFKHYPNMEIFNTTAGKRNCPKEFIQVEATIVDGKVTTTPPFIVGEPMQSEQSCGNEGNNVFSTTTGMPGKETYKGCFKVPSDSDDLIYQDGLGENATFETCKQLAHDSGSTVFSLVGDTVNKLKCYIGSSIDSIKVNGNSIRNKISWKTPDNIKAINATFNRAGQLIIKGNVSGSSRTNLTPGLKYTVRKGYMNDNVNYFKKDIDITRNSIITTGTTNNLTNISYATNKVIDNNSTKVSVEWIGYIKCNLDTKVGFILTSDDCSYMWIGDEAISNYTKNNAFIENGGLHPARSRKKTLKMASNKYYPIRIQFGQNKGKIYFSLLMMPFVREASVLFLTTPSPFISKLIIPEDKIMVLGDLWSSNDPQENCDPEIGGGIKLSKNITWGGNCNSFTGPNNTNYNVENGNVYGFLSNKIQDKSINEVSYLVGNGFSGDPAYGCPKNFNAEYSCGNGTAKVISINGEANGKIAVLNCDSEYNECNNYRLVVQDDGNLVIYGGKKNNGVVWHSNTYNKIDMVNNEKKAINGKYKRNYLVPGETLNDGEFIGSLNGKCFLQMIKGRGLVLMYSSSNCYEKEGKMYGNISTPNSITSATYVMPENDLSNIYKVGYIDRNSNLKPYDDNLVTKSNAYAEIGNFRLEGTPIKKIYTNDLNLCKLECSKDPNCDGFTIGNNVCELRNRANIFPNVKRYSDPNQTLYKRLVNVKNNPSCSKTIVPISVDQYSGYVKGSKMDTNNICSLGIYNKKYYDELKKNLNSLETTVNKINSRLNKLSNKDKKLLERYGLTENKLKRDIILINNMRNKYLEFKPKLETVKGMEINTEDEMMSKSYYNMLWSILAIMIVIGGIKMAR